MHNEKKSYNKPKLTSKEKEMGNQVVIAIRHDVKRETLPEFSMVNYLGLNTSELVPKAFQATHGIIVSKYHHANDKISVVVNNSLMATMPGDLKIYESLNSNEKVVDNLLKAYQVERYSKIEKEKKESSKEKTEGEKVSLFGYLTDETGSIPQDAFKQMYDAIQDMEMLENGHAVMRSRYDDFDNSPIMKIGTINADQMVFIEMHYNSFIAVANTSNKMDDVATEGSMRDKVIDFDTKFLKSMGYDVKVKPKDLSYL